MLSLARGNGDNRKQLVAPRRSNPIAAALLLQIGSIMTAPQQHFCVHNVSLAISSVSETLTRRVGVLLAPFADSRPASASYRVALDFGIVPIDGAWTKLPAVGRATIPNGGEVRYFADAQRRITVLGDLAWMHLDFAGRQAQIILRPDAEWVLEPGCLMPLLCDLLGREHHHVFHAATLAVETPDGPRAIVLAGISGAGKTTTSLALTRQGLRLLTDDASFLVRRGTALNIWGFPRPCKVHRHTLSMLPWLGALEPNPVWRQEEFTLDITRIAPYDAAREIAPGLLVLVEPRNDQAHRLTALDKVAALTEMTRQNVRTVNGFAIDTAGRSFEALGQLVVHSRTFKLSIGPDLSTLGATLRGCLEN